MIGGLRFVVRSVELNRLTSAISLEYMAVETNKYIYEYLNICPSKQEFSSNAAYGPT
jgi:hypothetical protein